MTKLVAHAVHRSSNLNTEQATSNEDEFERCDSPAYCTDTATGDPVVHTWRVYRQRFQIIVPNTAGISCVVPLDSVNDAELIAEFATPEGAMVFIDIEQHIDDYLY